MLDINTLDMIKNWNYLLITLHTRCKYMKMFCFRPNKNIS